MKDEVLENLRFSLKQLDFLSGKIFLKSRRKILGYKYTKNNSCVYNLSNIFFKKIRTFINLEPLLLAKSCKLKA